MASSVKSYTTRLGFLDWTRGLAALIMLQGHVFHSFTRPDLRGEPPFVLSQFVGGLAAAIFLFLTGVTLAFLMASRERQGATAASRVAAALRRGGYLMGVAFLFRLQMWLFGLPDAPWTDLFKVDILNCMAVAVLMFSPLAALRLDRRLRAAAAAGVAVAAASPLLSQLNWGGLHPFLRHYLVPDYHYFSLFPWASFLAFGLCAGSLLRLAQVEDTPRLMQWTAIVGAGLILGGQYFSNLPYSLYPAAEFWLNSPALVAIKLGVILLIVAFAFLWNEHVVGAGWNWLRQLGTTSLLVYWVHIELVYGRWLGGWKEALTAGHTLMALVTVVLLMLALSVARTRLRGFRLPRFSFWVYEPNPRRASGD